jgi:hypothetical protein
MTVEKRHMLEIEKECGATDRAGEIKLLGHF